MAFDLRFLHLLLALAPRVVLLIAQVGTDEQFLLRPPKNRFPPLVGLAGHPERFAELICDIDSVHFLVVVFGDVYRRLLYVVAAHAEGGTKYRLICSFKASKVGSEPVFLFRPSSSISNHS